jgi:hypothetical protein
MSFSFDNSYTLAISNGHWIVTDGHGTVTLTGETSVVIGSQTYDLVDHLGAGTGGYGRCRPRLMRRIPATSLWSGRPPTPNRW